MTITNIILKNLPEIVKNDNVEPTDEVLDIVWNYLKTQNPDVVSWAIESWHTEKLDSWLEQFVESGTVKDAITLRKYMKACFRDYARKEIMGYETSLLEIYRYGGGVADLPEYNAETDSYV